jgi:outer membrane lipoprotein-sorting protein
MAFALHRRVVALLVCMTCALFAARRVAADVAAAISLVDRMQTRLAQCKDYQYRLTSYERKGDREEERSYRLFVKDSRLVRIQVVGGRGKGSEAVLDARGEVRARQGGALKLFPKKLSLDDRRVCSLRGTPFWRAACHNFLKDLRARITQPGMECELSPDHEHPALLLLVLQQPAEGCEKYARCERYWIDTQQMHVVKGEVLEGDVLVERFSIQEIREDVGLSDSFFAF